MKRGLEREEEIKKRGWVDERKEINYDGVTKIMIQCVPFNLITSHYNSAELKMVAGTSPLTFGSIHYKNLT